MDNRTKKYPIGTRRNISVAKAKDVFLRTVEKPGKVHVVAGRVVGPSFAEASEGATVVAGRIVGVLEDGFVLQDFSGRMDVVFDGEVNVGDIVDVEVMGERVVNNGEEVVVYKGGGMEILAPCVGEFFIKKSDHNYKKMIIDKFLEEKLIKRGEIVEGIKSFFRGRDFLEVETPQLVRLPGMEPYLDVFSTQFIDQAGSQSDMFLITSPEYAMKKLLISGYEKIFQICRSFRNKETDSQLHNPEFTLLEWYQSYASYEEIMKDTEELVESLAKQLFDEPKISFQGANVDVTTPWPRVKVKDLFKDYAGIAYSDFEDELRFREIAREKGYKVDDKSSYEDVFFNIFMNEIEPKLGFDKPLIVYEYPVKMAALSKKCEDDPAYAERFEVYIAGVELCNAFTELNDPVEQKLRLEQERKERRAMGKDDYMVDQSFIRALEFGMPPSGGNAFGVDRLVMLLTDTPDIRDVMYFPFRDL